MGVLAVHGVSMVGRVVCWQFVVVDEDVEDGGEMRSRMGVSLVLRTEREEREG